MWEAIKKIQRKTKKKEHIRYYGNNLKQLFSYKYLRLLIITARPAGLDGVYFLNGEWKGLSDTLSFSMATEGVIKANSLRFLDLSLKIYIVQPI